MSEEVSWDTGALGALRDNWEDDYHVVWYPFSPEMGEGLYLIWNGSLSVARWFNDGTWFDVMQGRKVDPLSISRVIPFKLINERERERDRG